MRHITVPQMKKLHALAKELGMDDDLLHEYVSMMTDKTSLKELSMQEAIRVIDGLEGKKDYSKGDRISYRQEQYIMLLAKQLGWVEDEKVNIKRLNGFVKKYCGVEDYRWCTRKLASNVIEGLKDMLLRKSSKIAE